MLLRELLEGMHAGFNPRCFRIRDSYTLRQLTRYDSTQAICERYADCEVTRARPVVAVVGDAGVAMLDIYVRNAR